MKKLRRVLALISAVLMMGVALTVNGFAVSPFSDVQENRWSYKYILTLYEDGIIHSKGNDRFAPDDNITRAEFVKILGGIEGIRNKSPKSLQFKDVNKRAWYAGYVAWAAEAGVTTGTSSTTFSPDARITRQDMAVMIYRYAESKFIPLTEVNQGLTFADNGSIAAYAKSAVSAMQRAGIINGNGDGRFAPTENATREQACKMLCILYSMTPMDDRDDAFEAYKAWLIENAKGTSRSYPLQIGPCFSKEIQSGTSKAGNPYKGYFETYLDDEHNELMISIVYVEDCGDYDIIIETTRGITKSHGPSFYRTTIRATTESQHRFRGVGWDMSHLYSINGYLPAFDPEEITGNDAYVNDKTLKKIGLLTRNSTLLAAECAETFVFKQYPDNYSMGDLGFGI